MVQEERGGGVARNDRRFWEEGVAREVELKQSTHIETDVKHSPRGEKSNALEKPQSHEPRVKQQ